jgi:hypothetical protein
MAEQESPSNLGDEALKFWAAVTKSYRMRPDELRLLEDACREIDIIEMLEAEKRKTRFRATVKGSMGQQVINPVLQEVRQHRVALASLMKQLKLVDLGAGEEGEEGHGGDLETSARKAAIARWGGGRG